MRDSPDRLLSRSDGGEKGESVEHVIAIRRDSARPRNVLPALLLADRKAKNPARRAGRDKNRRVVRTTEVVVFHFRDSDGLVARERQLTDGASFFQAAKHAYRLEAARVHHPLLRGRGEFDGEVAGAKECDFQVIHRCSPLFRGHRSNEGTARGL